MCVCVWGGGGGLQGAHWESDRGSAMSTAPLPLFGTSSLPCRHLVCSLPVPFLYLVTDLTSPCLGGPQGTWHIVSEDQLDAGAIPV